MTGAIASEAFREEDFEAAFALYRAAMGAHVARAFGWDEAFQRLAMRRTLAAPRVRVYRSGDTIVAFFATRAKGEATEIFLICVDEAFQRRGLGTRMIEEIEQAAGLGTTLVGAILPGVDVVAFYTGLGFEAQAREDGGFRIEKRALA
ncbi:MAG: GNAT family N-acetyltransferase [Rhodoblastus sp.]|nr:MAG: GNAT family N-acetyltransferase [Rhodoblastus sp.]